MAKEIEVGGLPRWEAAAIEIIEPAGSERTEMVAVGSDGGARVRDALVSAEGATTEGPRDGATPRWRTASQLSQGPPAGGTEIQAGPEPAEVLSDGVRLQRDE